MWTVFGQIIFEPSCAGSYCTIVQLLLVAGVRRHTGYMERMAIDSCLEHVRAFLSISADDRARGSLQPVDREISNRKVLTLVQWGHGRS